MDYYKNDDDFGCNIISTNINSCLFSSSASTSPPSTPPSAGATDAVQGPGLYRARLILENHLYDELLNRYRLAVTRLRELSREFTALQEENEWLKLANEDLTRRLNRAFSVPEHPCYGPVTGPWSTTSSNHNNNNVFGGSSNNSSTSVIDDNEEEEEDERFSLPKSISVRSPGFFKLGNSTTTLNNQSRSSPQHVNATKLKVRREEKAIEMEVFNQGMYKTELCNKWQETGTCPYGQHCQFAHGVSELRPVIRHPRYKTQVCRMVVAGVACPYGHRCHFRHSLSPETNF